MNKAELLKRLSDIEWDDFEVKEARSDLPKSIWETVSAFANSSGGWIVLGVSQTGKRFNICGVEKPEKVEQSFTTVLRSRSKFNVLINPECKIVYQNPGRFDINISEWHKTAISKPRNPVIARLFRWAKLAENAGFGYDKMLAWKHKIEFDTYIDYSEATFYLGENVSSEKTVEVITPSITPQLQNWKENSWI